MTGGVGDLISWLASFETTLEATQEPLEGAGAMIRRNSSEASFKLHGTTYGARIVNGLALAYNSNANTLNHLFTVENDAKDMLNELMGL